MKMNTTEAYYKKMTETPVSRLIVTLGIPTTISMLVTSLYNMADTYFVGTLGESQQAATGILFTLQAIIQAFMLGQGSGTLVSKALADKNTDEASEYVSTAFFTGAAAGTALLVLGLSFLNPLLRLLGSTETILPYARDYGMWVLIACPFMVCSFVLNNNLRYEGKAFYAMIGLVSGGILNIFGDWLLIMVFDRGVFGAGLSTAVSQILSFLLLLYFHRKTAQGNISPRFISRRAHTYLTIARVGFPALIRQGLTSISNGLLNNLTKPYGDAAIAAMSVVNRYSMLVMCVGLGIGQGFQPVCGFNIGAERYDRVRYAYKFCTVFSSIFMLLFGAVVFMMSDNLISVFRDDPLVIADGTPMLRFQCITAVTQGIIVMTNMLLQNMGKTFLSSFFAMARQGLFYIPIMYIFSSAFGIWGIWTAQSAADVLTALLSLPAMFMLLKELKEKEETATM